MSIDPSLSKPDRDLLQGFVDRYADSGTLHAGRVYEATWDVERMRSWWNDLWQYDYQIAWVSDPGRVGTAPAAHVVALGTSGHTVHADGRRHRESGFHVAKDAERARAIGRANEELESPELRPLTATAGWNLLCGCALERVDLVLGWAVAEAPAPPGFDAVAAAGRTYFGLRLGEATRETGWARVDVSPAALKVALARARAIPGAPAGKPKLELVAGGRVLASRSEPLASGRSFEPSAAELASVLRMLDEISADSFGRALELGSLAREGEMLELIVDGDAVRIQWGGWASLRDVEAQLVAAIGQRFRDEG